MSPEEVELSLRHGCTTCGQEPGKFCGQWNAEKGIIYPIPDLIHGQRLIDALFVEGVMRPDEHVATDEEIGEALKHNPLF